MLFRARYERSQWAAILSAACLRRTLASCSSSCDRRSRDRMDRRACAASCRPNYDERPAGAELGLIVVHGISFPPGEFGNGWIDRFFCNDLPADVHPFFATICRRHGFRARVDRARRNADAVRAVRQRAPGTPGSRSIAGERPATTSRSGSSSKAPTTCRTRASSIERSPSSSPRCAAPTRRSRGRRSSATATSRPAARPIPGPPSIGRAQARLAIARAT